MAPRTSPHAYLPLPLDDVSSSSRQPLLTATEPLDNDEDDTMGGVAVDNTPTIGNSKLFSKGNRRSLLYASLAVIGAVLYGYDGTYFTGILAMDRFKNDYGTLRPDGTMDLTSSETSLAASIVQAGEFVGALASAPLGDWAGRRGGFLGACALVTFGVILQLVVAGSFGLLVAGRAVLGMGVGVISAVTTPYMAEITSPGIRAVVVSSWQLSLAIGQVIGAVVAQGTKDISSTWSYRIPIIANMCIVIPLVLAVLFVLPESPRWLASKNRDEKAIAALRKINLRQDDPDQVVELEWKTLTQAREDELAAQGAGGWTSIIKTKQDRRRLLMVLGVLASQQISGVQFIFSYATVFFQDVGIPNPFLITIVVDVIEVVGVLVSFFLVNRFGRRPLLIYSSLPMFASLFICGGLGTVEVRTDTQNRTIAAMICIYVFFFNIAWGPLAWVCASELSSGLQRTKVMAAGTALFWICAWAVTFTLPYLYDADSAGLGPQVGWIYGVGAIIAMIFVYFYIPETLGRSLEEIQTLISNDVPTRQWEGYVIEGDVVKAAHRDVASSDEGDVESDKGDKNISSGLRQGTQDA